MMGSIKRGMLLFVLMVHMLVGGVTTQATPLTDIQGHWAEGSIRLMLDKGVVKGYEDGLFRPTGTITVAEFLKVVVVLKGWESEVEPGGRWYEPYVRVAQDKGLVVHEEYKDYNRPISRYEMARVIARAKGKDVGKHNKGLGGVLKDESKYGQYSRYVGVVVGAGIITGYQDNEFKGERGATRAEAVVMLHRMIDETKREYTRRPVKVPVLMYHHYVEENPTGTSTVTVKKAEDDIKAILQAGYTFISLGDLHKYMVGELDKLPPKPIIMTVDDGYESVHQYLYPMAEKYGIKFTLGVIGWSVGADTLPHSDTKIIPHSTWETLKKMQDSGLVELQNHTYDLHTVHGKSWVAETKVGYGVGPYKGEGKAAYQTRLNKDIMKLEAKFKAEVGRGTDFIVYPYGVYTEWTEEKMQEYFVGSLTVKAGVREYRREKDLWEIPRISVQEDTDVLKEISRY